MKFSQKEKIKILSNAPLIGSRLGLFCQKTKTTTKRISKSVTQLKQPEHYQTKPQARFDQHQNSVQRR